MNTDQLLRFAEAAVVGGLIRGASPSIPFTIRLEDGQIVVRLEEPLTREVGLTIWDEIEMVTRRDDALVIDAAGRHWSRLFEVWP